MSFGERRKRAGGEIMSSEFIAILVTSAIEVLAITALWITTYRGQREMFRLSTNIACLVIQEATKIGEAIQTS